MQVSRRRGERIGTCGIWGVILGKIGLSYYIQGELHRQEAGWLLILAVVCTLVIWWEE